MGLGTFRYERFAALKEWRLLLVGITLLVQRTLVVSWFYVLFKKLIQNGFHKVGHRHVSLSVLQNQRAFPHQPVSVR